ncbi:MAG: S8 family serine peptidase [Candidatus Thorarchaeota archaeon]
MKFPINAFLLIVIIHFAFIALAIPTADSKTNLKPTAEFIHSLPPSEQNLPPVPSFPVSSFQEFDRVPNQWIIPSNALSSLINDGLEIILKQELPELDLAIIETNDSALVLDHCPQAFSNLIIRNAAPFSTDSISSDGYSFDTTLEWVGAKELQENNGLTGAGVHIAILDSGISSHELVTPIPESRSHSYVENDPSPEDGIGHGTAVASIISQVAPQAVIHNYRVFDANGDTQVDWILNALEAVLALNATIDIVQMSFGGYGIINEMTTIMDQMVSGGLIPVVSAGNSGPYGQSISRPAHSPSTIAVGATGEPDEVLAFSSQGPRLYGLAGPDLVAPGYDVEVASLVEGETTTYQNGTSFSSPFVSGGIALLLSADSLSSEPRDETRFWKLKAALMASAKHLDEFPSVAAGAGFIDLDTAFETLNDDVIVSMAPYRISASNYFFQITTDGQMREFPISIYSDKDYDASYRDPELPSGITLNFSVPDMIHTGLNILNVSIELNKDLEMDKYEINLDLQISSKLVSLKINLETRYSGGRILWDLREDNDSNGAAFSNGFYGAHSALAYWLTTLGRPSAAVVGNASDLYGTGYVYQAEEMVSILDNYDLLVISDPEYSYSSSDISIIQNWVASGKSLLIIADYNNQTESGMQLGSEHASLNTLLDQYGIEITNQMIPEDHNSTVLGTTVSKDDSGISPFSSQFKFDFIGVALDVTEDPNTKAIAYANNEPIAAVHKTISGGSVAVVGSDFLFSNLALYVPNANFNFKFTWQTIEWLLNAQEPQSEFTYSTDPLAFLGFNSDSKFTVKLSGLEGRTNPMDELDSFPGTLVESNGHYLHMTFRKKGEEFEASWEPTASGVATLYVNIQISGYAPLNGALQVDVVKGGFPIFLVLLLVLVVLGVGFFLYTSRKKTTFPDFETLSTRKAEGTPTKQDQMEARTKADIGTQPRKESKCISCGAPLFSGAAFCEKCGARQNPKEMTKPARVCLKCGAPIRQSTAQFCEFCGTRLEESN